MADNKDLTIYQKLFYLFGQNKKPERTTPKYSFGDGDLITTQSKQDYDKQKLELQQQNYLESQWQRVDSELYQKAVYYETSRIASYMDYEAMEFTPEISAALDIMAEESCLIGSTMIPLLNGTNISIEDLYRKKYTNFWVYGIKIDENKIKPSIVKGVIYKGIKDVYKITRQEADQIYKEEYWNIIKGDQLPPNVAHIMLSQALLDGPQDSIRLVQKLLGLKVDGIMGSDTINKIKRLTVNGDIKLAKAIANKQIYRLKTDEDADKFGKGWNNRVQKVMKKFKGK